MGTYVALLRGINLGSSKRVAMADLRALLTGLGHDQVTTILQSGNAVFTSTRRSATEIGQQISTRVAADLGVQSEVIVVTRAQLDAVLAAHPFDKPEAAPTQHHVAFLAADVPAARLQKIDFEEYAPEELHLGNRAAYLRYPNGMARAKLQHAVVEKLLGVSATSRNWNTVLKLQAAAAERG